MFGHERFEAYQLSIQFLEQALILLDHLPSGHSAIKEQLKKAAISVPLNIAEGTGRKHKPDRNRFYSIACGSAMECAAICDVVGLIEPKLKEKAAIAKGLLRSLVSILNTVVFENRSKG